MRKPTPLRNIRRARSLNQADLAGLINVSQQTLSKYESGRLVPTPDVQARIATILGVAVTELWPPTAERVSA